MLLQSIQLEEMRVSTEGLERERDFYFGKLRDIEVLCQEAESSDLPVVKNILDILYATEVQEDEDGTMVKTGLKATYLA